MSLADSARGHRASRIRASGRRAPAAGWSVAAFGLRRLAAGVPLLLGTTVVAFMLTHVVPGDPAFAALGERANEDPAAVAAFRAKYGLSKPLWDQYVIYLSHLAHFDFGTSHQTRHAVSADIGEFWPATFELAVVAILIACLCGVLFGVFAALRRDSLLDQLIRVASLAGVSVPTFWLALTVVSFLSVRLRLLPASGRLWPGQSPPTHITGLYALDGLLTGNWAVFTSAIQHVILPAAILAAYAIGLITRFSRASLLEVLSENYVRAARAKGLPNRTIVMRHVLRPALIPIITVSGLAFGALLSGAVVVERIFSWPGIGQYAYSSALALDVPAVTGISLCVAVAYMLVNLVVDLAYFAIDPRMRPQR